MLPLVNRIYTGIRSCFLFFYCFFSLFVEAFFARLLKLECFNDCFCGDEHHQFDTRQKRGLNRIHSLDARRTPSIHPRMQVYDPSLGSPASARPTQTKATTTTAISIMANMGSPQVSSASLAATAVARSRRGRAPLTPPPPTITTDLSLFNSFSVVPNSPSSSSSSTFASHDSEHHSFWRSRAALTSQSVTSLSLVADRADAHARECETSSLRSHSRPSRRPATAGADATSTISIDSKSPGRRRSSSLTRPQSPPPPSYEQCLQDAAASITARMATLYANRDSIAGSLPSTPTSMSSTKMTPTTTVAPRLPGTPTTRVPGSLRAPPPPPLTIKPAPPQPSKRQSHHSQSSQAPPTPSRPSFWQRFRRKGSSGENYHDGLATPKSAPLPRTSMSSGRHSRNDSEASIYAFDHDSKKYVRLSEIEGQRQSNKKKSSLILKKGSLLSIDTGIANGILGFAKNESAQRPAQAQARAHTEPLLTTTSLLNNDGEATPTPKAAKAILPLLNVNLPLNSPSSWDFGFSRFASPKSTQESLVEVQTPPTPPLTADNSSEKMTTTTTTPKTKSQWAPTIRVVEQQLPPSPVSMASSSSNASRASQSPSPTFGRNPQTREVRLVTPMICINDKPYNSDDEASDSDSDNDSKHNPKQPSLKKISAKKGANPDADYQMYWLAYDKSNPSNSSDANNTASQKSTFLSTEYQFSSRPRTIFNPHSTSSSSTTSTSTSTNTTNNYTHKSAATLSPKMQKKFAPEPVPISIPNSGEGADSVKDRWESVARRRLLGM